jgi:hypothetical protein
MDHIDRLPTAMPALPDALDVAPVGTQRVDGQSGGVVTYRLNVW